MKYVEHSISVNHKNIDRYYIRGKSKTDCVEILNKYGKTNCSYNHFREFALLWGTNIIRPTHEKRGLWSVENYGDNQLTPIWLEE